MKFLKQKMLIIFLLLILFFSFISQVSARTRIIPLTKKLKVVGFSAYLGYLNVALNITRGGVKVDDIKIFLNELLIKGGGAGYYSSGTSYHYEVQPGKKIIISYLQSPSISKERRRSKPIILGTYRINNIIEWVFPQPNAVIPVGGRTLSRTIRFRWNYTGRVLNTRVTITEFKKGGRTIFNRTIVGESIEIDKALFKIGTKYRFDIEVVGPMGHFRLSEYTAPGSKIDFYYQDHLYFMTTR